MTTEEDSELKLLDLTVSVLDKVLYFTWEDGRVEGLKWDLLRSACPCVVCKGDHKPVNELNPAKYEGIGLIDSAYIGKYALRFLWSDGHDTGIYSYSYLRKLCEWIQNV
tara:strand:- start:142 stop:468 length:327 start_codon:yes stop_codon:yes gene_type:complete